MLVWLVTLVTTDIDFQNNRRKAPLQPAKPRVLFLARDIGEQLEIDEQSDSILIASCKVSGEYTHLMNFNCFNFKTHNYKTKQIQ